METGQSMQGVVRSEYGGPEVLRLEEVPTPPLEQGHLLVKVKANSVNPANLYLLMGKPFPTRFASGLFKPKQIVQGADFSGVVEEVGDGVTKFSVGDHVFGELTGGGAFAEYACVPESVCGLVPNGAGFKEMACVPVAGLAALQALVTHGKLQAGESVLINGASGGVGHFAVQIAKALGAQVTAICSSKNTDFVTSIGADKAVAYDQMDISQLSQKHDLVVDCHGSFSYSDYKRLGNRGVVVGFTSMGSMAGLAFRKLLARFPLALFSAKANTDDLNRLAELIEQGEIRPHVDEVYHYTQFERAFAHIGSSRTVGKVAVSWE